MKTFKVMLKTELKLSFRGIDMLIFAIGMPLVILVILGAIYGNKPAFEGSSYTFLEQSFGPLTTIAICAGGVMGLPLAVSDYRSKKVLKRLKVTPIMPGMILLVELAVYTIYALASLALLWIMAKLFWGFQMRGSILQFLGGWLLVLSSMFSIGMMVGGIAKNTKIAGVIASILYFPMLIFSGATLPYEVMPVMMQKVANLLPLTQGIKIIKAGVVGIPMENVLLPTVMVIVLTAVCILISIKYFKWE